MKRLAVLSLLAASLPVHAQQVNMDAMMKWGAADLVRCHVAGVYPK